MFEEPLNLNINVNKLYSLALLIPEKKRVKLKKIGI